MTLRARGPSSEPEDEGKLSIGALSRATGIPVETLRTWEHRYGFPVPERKPSGHRVYPLSSVPRLRRIADALARGLRAGEVVPASESVVLTLLGALPPSRAPRRRSEPPASWAAESTAALIDAVAVYDAAQIERRLVDEWSRSTPADFLERTLGPLLRAMGDAWESGRLDIRHEHFASEKILDLLRAVRRPYEERAAGPLVVYATLPGESHGIGLQMAALVLSIAGCRSLYLGTNVPVGQLALLAKDIDARAVAISVSVANKGARTAGQLRRVREKLPRRVSVIAGGGGAPAVAGVELIASLPALDAWGRALVAASPAAAPG